MKYILSLFTFIICLNCSKISSSKRMQNKLDTISNLVDKKNTIDEDDILIIPKKDTIKNRTGLISRYLLINNYLKACYPTKNNWLLNQELIDNLCKIIHFYYHNTEDSTADNEQFEMGLYTYNQMGFFYKNIKIKNYKINIENNLINARVFFDISVKIPLYATKKIFTRVSFFNNKYSNSYFDNVVFDNCYIFTNDISNSTFTNCIFKNLSIKPYDNWLIDCRNIKFKNCKGTETVSIRKSLLDNPEASINVNKKLRLGIDIYFNSNPLEKSLIKQKVKLYDTYNSSSILYTKNFRNECILDILLNESYENGNKSKFIFLKLISKIPNLQIIFTGICFGIFILFLTKIAERFFFERNKKEHFYIKIISHILLSHLIVSTFFLIIAVLKVLSLLKFHV